MFHRIETDGPELQCVFDGADYFSARAFCSSNAR
jgi:hypothetical protein